MLTFTLPSDQENIFQGTLGGDTIYGGALADVIYTGGAPAYFDTNEVDTVFGYGGNDTVICFSPLYVTDPLLDHLSTTYVYGGVGADVLTGIGGECYLFGEGGNDKLAMFATPGAQFLAGWLDGGGGNDRLMYQGDVNQLVYESGGPGNDALWYVDTPDATRGDYVAMVGGRGEDKFHARFNLDNASTTGVEVRDFHPGVDRIFLAVIDGAGNVLMNDAQVKDRLDANNDGHINEAGDPLDPVTGWGVNHTGFHLGPNATFLVTDGGPEGYAVSDFLI